MDDDWDLHAVVRGCAAPSTATNNHSPISPPPLLHNDENPLDVPGLIDDHRVNPFQDFQEIYSEFNTDQSASAANTFSFPVGRYFQSLQEPPQMNMQRQENLQFKNPNFGSSSLSFPAASSQPNRPRRRKNQELKMVREMREEELSADSWSWRKYGQKPIKGSPHPRNYYRCSTSKGCGARKQVERSPNDPTIFVVSYTGEHAHPRPTHRSSLAGSTRSKLSPSAAAYTDKSKTPLIPGGPLSYSSPAASCSSFSPSPPLMEEASAAQNEVYAEIVGAEEEEEVEGLGGGDEDEENSLYYDSE